MPKMATWRARLARLLAVRKSSLAMVRAPTVTMRTMSAPLSRPAMSPRVLTRTRGLGEVAVVAGVTAASSSVGNASALVTGAFVGSSLRALLMTVVSMGSRHMSLGIGNLDVSVDDRVEMRIVHQAGDAVE